VFCIIPRTCVLSDKMIDEYRDLTEDELISLHNQIEADRIDGVKAIDWCTIAFLLNLPRWGVKRYVEATEKALSESTHVPHVLNAAVSSASIVSAPLKDSYSSYIRESDHRKDVRSEDVEGASTYEPSLTGPEGARSNELTPAMVVAKKKPTKASPCPNP
jgi:hypothetical protein